MQTFDHSILGNQIDSIRLIVHKRMDWSIGSHFCEHNPCRRVQHYEFPQIVDAIYAILAHRCELIHMRRFPNSECRSPR